MRPRTQQPDRLAGDHKPGAVPSAVPRTHRSVDLSVIPQLTEEQSRLLADDSKYHTREHRRAREIQQRIADLVKWEGRRLPDDED